MWSRKQSRSDDCPGLWEVMALILTKAIIAVAGLAILVATSLSMDVRG